MTRKKCQAIVATTAALWLGCVHAQSTGINPSGAIGAAQDVHASAKRRVAAKTRPFTDSTDVPVLQATDFFERPIGPEGLQIRPGLLAANGKQVKLAGYMVQQEQPQPGRFLLTPRPVQMSEHADGDADDLPPQWVLVELDPSQAQWLVPHQRGALVLRGVLHVGRHEDADGRIAWLRLQLPRDAVVQVSPTTVAAQTASHRPHRH